MKTRDPLLFRLGLAATILTLVVVVLGAFVRLSDAGLGCPDWPGCYGQIDVPRTTEQIERANLAFPERPVEVGKAWIEMAHRYVAGGLGLIILAVAIIAWRRRHQGVAIGLPFALLGMVIFQSLLGMWTVTLLLKPAIVTAHLLGGLTTLTLLLLLTLRHAPRLPRLAPTGNIKPLAWIALVVLSGQILLGGWTSTNYAALACPDFPTCQQQWWPETDFAAGFAPLQEGLGVNYEFGILESPARTAIHMAHRLGAIVAALALGTLAAAALAGREPPALRVAGATLAVLLVVQLGLGVGNIAFHLPLWMATAHNAGAALLLLVVSGTLYGLYQSPRGA
jgi:heme a synthase